MEGIRYGWLPHTKPTELSVTCENFEKEAQKESQMDVNYGEAIEQMGVDLHNIMLKTSLRKKETRAKKIPKTCIKKSRIYCIVAVFQTPLFCRTLH